MGSSVGASLAPPRKHVIRTDAAMKAAAAVKAAKTKGYKAIAGQVGITTYIRDVCRGGVKFAANRVKTARGTRGLTLGRQVDHQLRDWVDGDNKPLGRGEARRYIDSVAATLEKHKLQPCTTQLRCGRRFACFWPSFIRGCLR